MGSPDHAFEPERYRADLAAIFAALLETPAPTEAHLRQALRRYPKDGRGFFSKAELISGLAVLPSPPEAARAQLLRFLRGKPVRTLSGVAPVTVLTKPFPCPGACIFCPNDVRMPKSYLSMEPGAQRAGGHRFDPYAQTYARLAALVANGHVVDKVELIVLGGTFSFYPEAYQVWFIGRCFEAMNDFDAGAAAETAARSPPRPPTPGALPGPGERYNDAVRRAPAEDEAETGDWAWLAALQSKNEAARQRCVGLSLETRPDYLDQAEALRMRRLGATKVQLGAQSLDDTVLLRNRRGHDVAATRRAIGVLRAFGFKVQLHWMANLDGATPQSDAEDFRRLFADPGFRPDELKAYPCSVIEGTELMARYEAGGFRPYATDELIDLLAACLPRVPRYCRVSRVIRDIPSHDIAAGNRKTNLREAVDAALQSRGVLAVDIRAREVRDRAAQTPPAWVAHGYRVRGGYELFLECASPAPSMPPSEVAGALGAPDPLQGFLRLFLPRPGVVPPAVVDADSVALVREVHVYGTALPLQTRGEGAQHAGVGARLLAWAEQIAAAEGFASVAVIAGVGTRRYYARHGYQRRGTYMWKAIAPRDIDAAGWPSLFGVE